MFGQEGMNGFLCPPCGIAFLEKKEIQARKKSKNLSSDSTRMSKHIDLVSGDGFSFQIPMGIAMLFPTISNQIEDLEAYIENVPIPLPNVSAKIMKRVIDFAKHHLSVKESKPITEADTTGKSRIAELTPFEKEFCKTLDVEVFFDVMLAANYLEFIKLIHVCARHIADLSRDGPNTKPANEIRAIFNTPSGFSEEQEHKLREKLDTLQ